MSQRLPSLRDRLLSALVIALSMVLLAVIAATLKPSISTTAAPEPPKSTPTSGISLLALLYQLLNAFLALFGISLNLPSGPFSGGSLIGLVFSILQSIYQYRLAIITTIVLLTAIGLLYQYRHQLAVPHVLQSSSETTEPTAQSSSTAATSASWPPETAPESVQEAWVTMIQHVDDDVKKPASRTPTEWQQIAIDAGLPADAVETITTTFCSIQYGTASETDTHLEQVQAALNQLDTCQEATDE